MPDLSPPAAQRPKLLVAAAKYLLPNLPQLAFYAPRSEVFQ
jgi:hypothetical protein